MKRTIITVLKVTGNCNANYKVGERIFINNDTARIEKEQPDNLCIYALNSILVNMSRIRSGEKILTSCPDPATGLVGNVIFSVVKEESNDQSNCNSI